MRILIITQDEIFYLPENISYLIEKLSSRGFIVSGAVVLEQSPFAGKMTFKQKIRQTIDVFGWEFFTYYAIKFLLRKLLGKTVKKAFMRKGINVIYLNRSINHEDSLRRLKRYRPDVIVSIAANQIFKKALLSLAPKGCINLHTGMLPKYRGLMPTFWALKNGEKIIGVSVFLMDEGIDSGPILVQKKLEIKKNDTLDSVIRKSKRIGMDAIIEALEKLRNNNIDFLENNPCEATYYSFPTKKDVKEYLAKGGKLFRWLS